MNRRWIGWLVAAALVLIVVGNCLFVVDQRQEAVVLSFGDPVRVIHAPGQGGAGLNAKLPFVENVVWLDGRNQAMETDQEEIIGSDQQRLVVDSFLRYRISDPLQYYRTLHDEHTAQDRLERLVNSSLRQVLGSATSSDIISGRRDQLMTLARQDVERRAKESRLGIQIIDLRIKRADLPAENRASVYRRMQSARVQIATQIRAQGEQQKREIKAEADKEVVVTLANAQQQGQSIRGEGDAIRTRTFAQSFGKDPAFAAFYRSLQAYETGIGQGDATLVLSPDSAFFKYFEGGPSRRAPLMPSLERPALVHMASFIAAMREGYSRDTLRPETPETIAAIERDPAWFLRQLVEPPPTIVLPDGTLGQRVPETILWYVDGEAFLGAIQIRHHLNAVLEQWGGHIGYAVRPSARGRGYASAMLAGSLGHVRAHLPLTHVILTASQRNPASCRVIEKNGGALERAIPHPWHDGEIGARYRIEL